MGLRERLFGSAKPESNFDYGAYTANLSAKNKIVVESTPLGKKTTPELKRVPLDELEMVYKSEPNVFNAINKTTQLIMAAGYKLVGDSESVAFFADFFESIGSRGGELEWTELLTSVFKFQMVYGDAWVEKIPAKRDKNQIVDLQLVDPKKMDYAKDRNDKIVLDKFGDPVGYVETMPYEYTIEDQINPPEEVVLQKNQIFFMPNSITHFKLYTIGDGFYGTGMIEPTYQTVVRKLNMEEALANAVNRSGFPRILVQLGDPAHEPNPDQIQKIIDKVKNMNHMGVFGVPYWVKVSYLEASSPEKLQEHLDYYIDQIVTGTGLPKALATGGGQETNRSTLNRQEALAKLTLKDIIRRTTSTIEKQIIKPIAKGNKVSPVKIQWGEVSIEELDGKAKRLTSYVAAGLITPDPAIEQLIRGMEDLPVKADV